MEFEVIVQDKNQGALVVGRSKKEIAKNGSITLGDVKLLMGMETTHEDYGQGWTSLEGLTGEEIGEGCLLIFPPTTPL